MISKEQALAKITTLVERFDEQKDFYRQSDYNETLTRRDFIDPFFKALGWDIDNEQGYAESYREVIHEDKIKIGGATKAPDYSFRLGGGKRLFFVEAKKPSILIKDDITPAYQVRRYGWSAKLAISIITDFEEFAIYDCTRKPNLTDKASNGRIKYLTYSNYISEFDFIWETFSKEKVLKGSFDKFIQSDKQKKGTTTVDYEFLNSLDTWRTYLATNIALRNDIDEEELNFVVQHIIDRIIFLRIAEDRSIETYGNLHETLKSGDYYQNLLRQFHTADQKYNSGLFDFKKDKTSGNIVIDNKVIKSIINDLYYPISPYEFSVLSVEILGSAYEQFLGKQITLSKSGRAIIEEKPEVRKAGGVYYTPQYIVEYIVKNTVGKIIEGKTPKEISKIKIADPACGSGSFLIGAYQFLLSFHKDYYSNNGKPSKGNKDNPLTPEGNLTTSEKKRILLNNIFGVDLDANAVEVTKLSLLLKCMEGETEATIATQLRLFHERILPTLDDNIKSGNSLIDVDFYSTEFDFGEEKKVKPFTWKKAFPEVFNHGGFDCVIGNPPYGASFNETEKAYFTTKYKVSEGNYESFSFFIERASAILKQKGSLGYIIPDTWFTLKSAYKLRKLILEDYNISEIQMLNEKVFKSAKVDVCTFILTKEKADKAFNVFVYDKDADETEIEAGNYVAKNSFSKKEILADKEFSFRFKQNSSTKNLIAKMGKHPFTLDNFCLTVTGCKPYQVGKGVPKQTKQMLDGKIYTATKKKDKTYRRMLRGGDISRYSVTKRDDEWLSYGEWLAEPRLPQVFENPRLLFQSIRNPKLKRRLVGSYIDDMSVNNNSITNIALKDKSASLKFFLAILNSDLINWYFSVSYNIVNIDPRYLKMIPIPDFKSTKEGTKAETELISLADQLLKLHEEIALATLQSKVDQIESRINYCEQRINEIVYQLYGLTQNEIKAIEQNL
jgi:type I restriction-modification system DNA methylase subunit